MEGSLYTERRHLLSYIWKEGYTIFNGTSFKICYCCAKFMQCCYITFSKNSPVGIKKGAFVRGQRYIVRMHEGRYPLYLNSAMRLRNNTLFA